MAERTGQSGNLLPVIESALERSGERTILDLCSGGGGPIVEIARMLREAGCDVSVTLTDFFPSDAARSGLEAAAEAGTRYEGTPVDATAVPADRPGLRTLFNSFHHFRPPDAARILASAVESGRPIAVVEVMQRKLPTTLGMLLAPIFVFLSVPFLRPFRPTWLVFTYLIPVIPLFVLWDGFVSTLRIYDREELLDLARRADPDARFDWEVTEVPMPPAPVPGIALIGIPASVGSAAGPSERAIG